jgi:HSP20 family molecular chaperone IbpA
MTTNNPGGTIEELVRSVLQTAQDVVGEALQTTHEVVDNVTGRVRGASLGRNLGDDVPARLQRPAPPSWRRIGIALQPHAEGVRAATDPGRPAAPIAVDETDERFILLFDVLGWHKNELTVRTTSKSVRVHGKTPTVVTEHAEPAKVEPAAIEYDAVWRAPEGVELDPTSAQAHLENGVLKVAVKTPQGHGAHKVEVT